MFRGQRPNSAILLPADAISGSIPNDNLNLFRLKHFAMRHFSITPSIVIIETEFFQKTRFFPTVVIIRNISRFAGARQQKFERTRRRLLPPLNSIFKN
jgi:hypothetical protein